MRALVTGGGGFLGFALVEQLLQRGDEVVSFSRRSHRHVEERGAREVCGDLANPEAVLRAAEGCDVVFHVAARAGIWGAESDYYRTNVKGTQHVIDAARSHSIRRLIYTSSPSVVFAGTDQEGVDEREPYPRRYLAAYPRTKAQAEQRVRSAGREGLLTLSLRPHLIWGPRDNHLVPRVISRARRGKLRLVGSGDNRVDSVYVDNAAEAHLLAAEALERNPELSGRTYFISQGEPLPMRELLDRILAAGGLPPVSRSVSPRMAWGIGALLEGVHRLLRKESEPIMTRFLARQLATAHWFEIGAARRELGYAPRVSLDEGFRRLASWLEEQDRSAGESP